MLQLTLLEDKFKKLSRTLQSINERGKYIKKELEHQGGRYIGPLCRSGIGRPHLGNMMNTGCKCTLIGLLGVILLGG